jgi:hypothetical protein
VFKVVEEAPVFSESIASVVVLGAVASPRNSLVLAPIYTKGRRKDYSSPDRSSRT